MKNWIKRFTKEQIQRVVFIALLVLVFAVFFISLSIASSKDKPQPNDPVLPSDPSDQDKEENKDPEENQPNPPAPIEKESFVLPLRGDYQVVRKFYDASSTTEDQELAVIQFEKTYYISNGVAYMSPDKGQFNVIASLSGEVVRVDESPIYGVVITLKHENDIYTEYGSLTSSKVKVGDQVMQGDVLGVSGVCEYDSVLASHVFFKVLKNNVNQDPEKMIGKKITDL